MATDDLRLVLRGVLEAHDSVETGLWGVVNCTCRRNGMMSRPEYREHVTRMQLDAIFASDWYAEYGRMCRSAGWDEGRESVGLDLLRPRDEHGMRTPTPNPYEEDPV